MCVCLFVGFDSSLFAQSLWWMCVCVYMCPSVHVRSSSWYGHVLDTHWTHSERTMVSMITGNKSSCAIYVIQSNYSFYGCFRLFLRKNVTVIVWKSAKVSFSFVNDMQYKPKTTTTTEWKEERTNERKNNVKHLLDNQIEACVRACSLPNLTLNDKVYEKWTKSLSRHFFSHFIRSSIYCEWH